MSAERRARFPELHAAGLFVMPNPWDVGSAKLLAWMGFHALATTSAGLAWSLGRLDQNVSRAELVAHVEFMAAPTPAQRAVRSRTTTPRQIGSWTSTPRPNAWRSRPGRRRSC